MIEGSVCAAHNVWSGAGSNRRPSAFQGLAFPQVTPPALAWRAICVRHQCFTMINRGSFAASPCEANSDSAEAISASRPSTACR